MTKDYIRSKIIELGPWYQRINLDDIYTCKKRDVNQTWKTINDNFYIHFKNSRILDLGCNAGYYSVMSCINGASVIGVEAFEKAYNQALFIKKYYEAKLEKQLDITYIHKDISDLNFESFGKFDYIFALAILYHIGNFKYGKGTKESLNEQERILEILTNLSNNFLVRARERKVGNTNETYNPTYYNKIFKKFGFKPVKTIYENTQSRSLILYTKN